MKIVIFLMMVFSITLQSAPISCGKRFCLLVSNDGQVWGFGDNQKGQLGLGHKNRVDGLVQIRLLANIVSVVVGTKSSIALESNGTIWFWIFDEGMVPQQLPILKNTVSIDGCASSRDACVKSPRLDYLAIDHEGSLWDFNENLLKYFLTSQDIKNYPANDLRKVENIEGRCVATSVDSSSTMVLDENGKVYFWSPRMMARQWSSRSDVKPTEIESLTGIHHINTGWRAFAWNDEGVWGWQYCKDSGLRKLYADQEESAARIRGYNSPQYFKKLNVPANTTFITSIPTFFALDLDGTLWRFHDEWRTVEGLPPLISAGNIENDFPFPKPDAILGHGFWAIDEDGKVWLIGWFFNDQDETIISLNRYFNTDFTAGISLKKHKSEAQRPETSLCLAPSTILQVGQSILEYFCRVARYSSPSQ